jgi:hypothetical protein
MKTRTRELLVQHVSPIVLLMLALTAVAASTAVACTSNDDDDALTEDGASSIYGYGYRHAKR